MSTLFEKFCLSFFKYFSKRDILRIGGEYMSFGEKLKKLREERGISQKMLAIRLEIAQSSVSDWEADRKMPPVKTILKIADTFDVSLDLLFDRSQEQSYANISIVPAGESRLNSHNNDLLNAYEALSTAEQQMLCRMLGITHPADERSKASKA